MKLMNNIFMGLFLLISVSALFAAVFMGANWHYATFIMSLLIAWLFRCENQQVKR